MIETGAVDVMIDIRGNFFYTRTVPCQLWFFDRGKRARPAARSDHVLMLDVRNIHRKVSRAVFDFSPEQQKNIAAIVWLYRGQSVSLHWSLLRATFPRPWHGRPGDQRASR